MFSQVVFSAIHTSATSLLKANKSLTQRKRERERRHLHSIVGDNLVSILVPCDQRLRERVEGRRADDGGPTLTHSLSLLLGGKIPHNWKNRDEQCQDHQQ